MMVLLSAYFARHNVTLNKDHCLDRQSLDVTYEEDGQHLCDDDGIVVVLRPKQLWVRVTDS